jgi:hypothetical protein
MLATWTECSHPTKGKHLQELKGLTTSIAKKGIEKFNLTIEQSKLIASLDERITDVHKLHKSNLKGRRYT